MKKYLFLLTLMVCFFKSESQQVPLNGGNVCEDKNFNLLFEDNFDGPLNTNKWYTHFPYGEGNSDQCPFCRTHDTLPDDPSTPFQEGQIYLDENVRTEGGKLIFDIKNESADWYGQFKNYTSGMIHSKTFYGYGKFEIRCKIPDGYAHFPAFWIQDGNYEIDIYESWGPENGPTDKYKCSVHNYNVETSDFWVEPEIDLSADFHTYSVIYGQDRTFFYIDDELVGTVSRYFTLAGDEIGCEISTSYYVTNPAYPPIGKHFRVIANAAVVGGPAANNEVPEGTMEIDYIRVYEFDTCDYTPYACGEGINNTAVTIDHDQQWDKCEIQNVADQYEYIKIAANNTLTLKECDLKMLLPGKIIVESGATLILDNTTIRPCDESYRWQGIFLANGANLELKNGSKIIQSKLGIYNSFDFVGYVNSEGVFDNYALQYSIDASAGNNTVSIDNSSFEDNFHALLLDGDNVVSVDNNSKIKDSYHGATIRGNQSGSINFHFCDFEENLKSIHLSSCNEDISIYNCKFTNDNSVSAQIQLLSTEGMDFQMNEMSSPGYHIQAFESHMDITNNNKFHDSNLAIWAAGTFPLGGSARIGDLTGEANYFSDNSASIKLNGLNSVIGGRIRNNQLDNTNQIAVDVNGIGFYRINNNTIDNAEDGLYFGKTGEMNNTVNCNLFENNAHQDLTIELDNNNTLFLQNDFSSSQNDGNIILSQARVFNEQGTEDNPSDNCFNLNSIEDLYTDAATSFFRYHHNQVISCRIPSGNGNYQPLETFAEGDNCPNNQIGSNFTGTSSGGHTPIRLLHPLGGVYTGGIIGTNVSTALNNLLQAGGDDPYTYPDESLPNTEILPNVNYAPSYLANIETIYNYESELDYWIRVGIQYASVNDDYVYGENLLLPLKKWRWQEMLFGLYVKSRQYTKARTLLNSLPSYATYEGEFIALQHINLDRLLNGEQSITPTQIQTVYAIATGSTPASGYAIPLYYLLTDIRLQSTVPTKDSSPRAMKIIIESGLHIAPNPVEDHLTILNPKNLSLSKIVIIDRYYQVKLKPKADNQDRINISNLVSGWYMLKCVVDDKEIVTLPFVKI